MNRLFKKISFIALLLVFVAGAITSNSLAQAPTPTPPSFNISVDGGNAKSGLPGQTVTYTVTIQNISGADLTANITAESTTGSPWISPTVVPSDPTLNPSSLPIANGGSAVVSVVVPIPGGATEGQNDISVINVSDGMTTQSIQLNTSVKPAKVAGRPMVTIGSYTVGDKKLYAGNEMTLQMALRNDGSARANNVVVTFDGGDFFPRDTGGVRSVGSIDSGGSTSVSQKFLIGEALMWANVASIKATVSYTDASGNAFSENFTLPIVIAEPSSSGVATSTSNVPQRPQLVVTGYITDVDPLQPGSIFELELDVKNLGQDDAKRVSAVIGGGVTVTNDMGTPQPGGVSGSGGDLTTFAPLGSSNIVVIGDINKDVEVKVTQKLVVNVTAQPGAYPLKLSFVYTDSKGNRIVDDQIITLLVYSLPQVEVSFYRDAGMITAGMENILPLQITNLGRKTSVLGNMKVTAENADVFNNVMLVGALDPGGFFTLDTSLTPYQEGPLELKITISFTDDFNQPRSIEQIIPIEVQPAMEIPPDMNGENPGGEVVEPAPETFWQKVVRFFKGMIGLDSGVVEPVQEYPVEEYPDGEFIPVPSKGG